MKQVRQQIGGLGNLMFKQAYLVGQVLEGKLPDLYLQSEKYWKNHKGIMKQMFSDGIGYTDMVALQIRRGDYVGNSFYLDITKTDYYENAIKMFPNEYFLIFYADRQNEEQDKSDHAWCREWAENKGIKYEIWKGKNEVEDLNKFASCKAKIIANSTFGWWAGYLGRGKVVAPQNWFTDGVQRCELPEEFIQI